MAQRGIHVLLAGMEAPPNFGPDYTVSFRQVYRDLARQYKVPLLPFLLDNVAGIVFGQLSLDRSEEDEFEDFLLDLISDLDVPVLMDFPAGHENPNLTIPFGTEIELVVEEQRGWIMYREDALSPPVSSEIAPMPSPSAGPATDDV